MKRRLTCALLLVALAACGRPAGHLTRIEGASMGTTYGVQIVERPPALDARGLHARVDGVLVAIERKMSTYDPESELSRFNASASIDWFGVSADTLAVIEEALRVSRLTDGAFDITVGPLVELWGFGPSADRRRPPPEAITAVLEMVGYQLLETRASPPSIRKHIPELRIDLSAIAKGFAVDEVARLLEAQGFHDFLVEVGGELRASGCNLAGAPWRVAVERPQPAKRILPCILQLVDDSVASSGDYRNTFEEDGVRYAHVIDPRTGLPVSAGIASATVLSDSAMEADAFATALMLFTPEVGLRLAEREGLAARLLVRVDGGFVERSTSWFPERVP